MGDDSGMGTSAVHQYSGYEDGGGIPTPRAGTPQATLASKVGQAELDERKWLLNTSGQPYLKRH